MRKLGTIDLEILHLAMEKNGTFNEKDLENSELKRLGVGKILDSLASLKDRNMISLNNNGSFSITELAKEILWSKYIPTWAKILRILQIKSCKTEQIADILRISKTKIIEDLERLRKKQFILMSPQRQDNKIVRVYEILPDGIDEIDKTEIKDFDKTDCGEFKPKIETLSIIEEIVNEIQNIQIEQSKKDSIITKLSKLKNKLEM
ncbi:MAG: hypothetical protein ACRBB5_05615 [Nitrosopumilus sp.]